jgi:class 3 adenylate cyclase
MEPNGIVSQILGDGIMVVFGARVVTKDHVNNAVNAGYAMID